MIAPPPPTLFRALADQAPAIAERLGTLWRLATTDDQRWELERLAMDLDDNIDAAWEASR